MDNSGLIARSLTRSFGAKEVFRDLSFSVDVGQKVALVGPNGSGKTTLLRCAAGSLTPTHGEIHVRGHPAGTQAAVRLLGLSLAQDRSFYLRLTGEQNLLFFARLRTENDKEAHAAVGSIVEELALEEIVRMRTDRCSSGMLQRLGLARALLGDPDVLLLDEPTRSLDTHGVELLWSVIKRRTRLTLLMATHLDADMEKLDRSIELGRVVA